MNSQTVRAEIEKVIADNRQHMTAKQVRKQYAVGKAQLAKLTELGILELMPIGFGFSDADAVIRAAGQDKSTLMNAFGEGEDAPASALHTALETEPKLESTADAAPDYEYILDAIITVDEMSSYEDESEFIDLQREMWHIANESEDEDGKVHFDRDGFTKSMSDLRQRLADGKRFKAEGYRVRSSDRIVNGHAWTNESALDSALATRRQDAGYLAFSACHQWFWLVKNAS